MVGHKVISADKQIMLPESSGASDAATGE